MEKSKFSKKNFRSLVDNIEAIVHNEMTESKLEKDIENIRYLSEFLIYSNK